MAQKTKLTFCSGVGTATGANFLLETEDSHGKALKILIDCGLVQGSDFAEEVNRAEFVYNPAEIDYLFVTHAHADHIGRIGKLVKEGFRGIIYSTPETRAISGVMLPDILMQMNHEAEQKELPPLYGKDDVNMAMSLWREIPYHTAQEVAGFTVTFRDAGHILGSAMITFARDGKNIVFTGDLGNTPTPLLKDTEQVTDATYMVMESVYGDRNHEPKATRREKLKQVIMQTRERGGTLMIPSFSLERTQVLLHELNHLVEMHEIPEIPVFLDSPLAQAVTSVYEKYQKNYNEHIQADLKGGDEIFRFPGLRIVHTAEDSRAIVEVKGPKIIIAGSGMSSGGRIIHHEAVFLPDPKSTLLLVGYQSLGTLGRKLLDGAKTVVIHRQEVPVRAHVESILGYSSHKDSDHLVEFVADTSKTLKAVYVAMGEPKSSLFLVQRLRDYLGVNAVYPQVGTSVTLDL